MDWKRIFSWVILLIMVGCSTSLLIITKPQEEVNIELIQDSKVDSVQLPKNIKLNTPKIRTTIIKKPVVVDSTGSK